MNAHHSQGNEDRRLVLLDTDVGSDVDDAVAIAYLLAHPQCDLVGITTVSGDTAKRAALAESICNEAGAAGRVPIVAGLGNSLLGDNKQPAVPQYRGDELGNGARWKGSPVVSFMREMILSHPHQVSLLTIGPLTNVAALFAAYPETAGMLREIVTMGANFSVEGGKAEWNIYVDPVAAAIVFSADVPAHHVIGLDVTTACFLDGDDVLALIRDPRSSTVRRVLADWVSEKRRFTLHDPLAATCLFGTELMDWRTGWVAVDLSEEGSGRTTLRDSGSGSPRQVAWGLRSEACMEEIRRWL